METEAAYVIGQGALASLIAGLATVLGALPLFWMRQPDREHQNLLLGLAAGVMLAASFFSLIIPAIVVARQQGASAFASSLQVTTAVLLGALAIAQLNRYVPPLDKIGLGPPEIAATISFRRIWLLVAAITLHNFPEGMAVGVSFGGGDFAAGRLTALGIGLQNIPEGLAVAVALTSVGYSRRTAVLAALASGLVEPVAGLIGVTISTMAQAFLPWGLGLAAGAMIFVVHADIMPEAHAGVPGSSKAGAGLMIGLGIMMVLDTMFA